MSKISEEYIASSFREKSKTSKNHQKLQAELSLSATSDGFLLSLLFHREDAGDKIFENVGLSPNYMTL
jgi:hypothetical protein